ncbi:MAG: tRNA 4-thiouridine(8) synthase ThiI, partial [Lachnospiraceae bacterium]|nr:tRNA 4-thiouridine(8) synthase ThiI [Lachnospiraceae bacterium]
MSRSFLIKYAEIGLKGKNRYKFEDALVTQIRSNLRRIEGEFDVSKINGRIFVNAIEGYDLDAMMGILTKVFGIIAICPVDRIIYHTVEGVCSAAVKYVEENYENKSFSFKVDTRRSNKAYPKNSMEMDALVGEAVLGAFPETHVDV